MKNHSMVTATCLALALFTLSAIAGAGGFVSKDGKYYLCRADPWGVICGYWTSRSPKGFIPCEGVLWVRANSKNFAEKCRNVGGVAVTERNDVNQLIQPKANPNCIATPK